jgi:hypothetical protein
LIPPAQQPAKIILKENGTVPKPPEPAQTPSQDMDKILEKLKEISTPQ